MKKLATFILGAFSLGVSHAEFTPGNEYNNQPGLATINAKSAYDQGYSGNGVKIGIVDSGIDTSHVEFTNAISAALGWTRKSDTSLLDDQWVSTTGTSNFSSFLNDKNADGSTINGHGSFVSSIAAARLDDSPRSGNIMGVAYNAKLVIGQMIFNQCDKDAQGNCRTNSDGSIIYKAYGLNDAQSAQAINYVVNQGVKVINNSWGVSPSWGNTMTQSANAFVADQPQTTAALINAVDKGAVVVFAAGNESIAWPGAPATLPSVNASLLNKGGWIVVAATTNRGLDASGQIEMAQYRTNLVGPAQSTDYYTNYCGDAKNYCISAPGGFVNPGATGADVGMSGALAGTTDSYEKGNGTSYAAPVVSGAVALVAEKYPWMTNKNLSVTILTTGTTAATPSAVWGRGLLDMSKAINGPAIFEEDFEANVTSGYSSTFSNTISGAKGIKKLGDGSLTLDKANTFTGNTYLNGGTLVVNAQSGLGNTSNALQFDGGTLKFGSNFDLTRALSLGGNGGAIDLNGHTKTQTFNISGSGQFGVKGAGTLTLDRANTQSGGIAITSTAGQAATVVKVQNDTYLGLNGSKVNLDGGELVLLDGYVPAASGAFTRPLSIGLENGRINTSNNVFAYTGGLVDSSVAGNTAGALYFSGTPFTMGADLKLNAFWGANLTVPTGMKLSGLAGVASGYTLTVNGTYAPGNSPGTMESYGSIVLEPGSVLDIEIDGTGTEDGAGNYDRIVLLDSTGTFTAGGSLEPTLRGISSPGTNTYRPSLGQGFQIVTAPGGILGNFATFTQPTSGLLSGTQFDTVFGSTSLSLYATPSSYSNIAAAGVASNNNRQQIGDILQPIRPTPGIRESNATRKLLFDSLASQTSSSLPVAMDQLGGVGYGQIIGMNFENSKFLANQTAATVALHRRNEGKHLVAGDSEQTLGDVQEEFWGTAIARLSDWRRDNLGYNTYDVLGGVMAGVQKRFTPQNLAGFSIAYAGSSPTMSQNMGSGPMQNVQIMGYGSHDLEDGFFVQGTLGGGGGSINASRNISMMGASYKALIQTANLAGSMMTGWGTEVVNQIRYETGIGVNYLGMRQFGFSDSGNQSAFALTTQSNNAQSLVPNLSASASIPFKALQIDWRAQGLVNVGYETADNKITLQSNFMGSPITVDSGSIGRTRLNLGLGVSGAVGRETRIALEVANQSAQYWNATAANVSLRVGF